MHTLFLFQTFSQCLRGGKRRSHKFHPPFDIGYDTMTSSWAISSKFLNEGSSPQFHPFTKTLQITLNGFSHLLHVVLIPKHTRFCHVSKVARAEVLLSDTKFLNTCSFTIHFKMHVSACSMVLVELLKKHYTYLSMKYWCNSIFSEYNNGKMHSAF